MILLSPQKLTQRCKSLFFFLIKRIRAPQGELDDQMKPAWRFLSRKSQRATSSIRESEYMRPKGAIFEVNFEIIELVLCELPGHRLAKNSANS